MRVRSWFVPSGGGRAAGLMVALAVGWACSDANRESRMPVLELEMDLAGLEPFFTAEDSAVVRRLENGEGPVRIRIVMCGEAVLDEVVSDPEDFTEVMERRLLEEFEWTEEWSAEALSGLEALDRDSAAAAWAEQWEALTPAERDSINAEMERIMPMVADLAGALDDPVDLDREALEALNREAMGVIGPEALEAARETACDLWRKARAEFRNGGP